MNIAELRDRPRSAPVYLYEIVLQNTGPTLYFSTRNITVSGQRYEAYIVEASGIDSICNSINSQYTNNDINIVFLNEAWGGSTYLIELGETYPFTGSAITIKRIYIDDNGDNSSDIETLFVGVLDEPRDISKKSFSCNVSSKLFLKEKQWQQGIINTSEFPNAWDDLGRYKPIVYGSNVLYPTPRTSWGVKTVLSAVLGATETTAYVSDEFNRLSSAGTTTLIIDSEEITFNTYSSTLKKITGITRGANATTPTGHGAGSIVWTKENAYDSLISTHSISALNGIYAEMDGYLLKVTAGVTTATTSGHKILRASSAIRVSAASSIVVTETSHNHASTFQEMEVINFQSITTGSSVSAYVGTLGYAINGDFLDAVRLYADAGSTAHYHVSREIDIQKNAVLNSVRLYAKSKRAQAGGAGTVNWLGGTLTLPNSTALPATTFITLAAGTTWSQLLTEATINITNTTAVGDIGYWLYEMWIQLYYTPSIPYDVAGIVASGGVVDTRFVDRFHVDINGIKDDSSGTITGSASAVIERPEYIEKHFLVKQLGYTTTEIDNTSFNACGTALSTFVVGGYKAGNAILDKINPSDWLQRLNYESRCISYYDKGEWKMHALSTSAPVSATTVSGSDLAGEFSMFNYDKTPVTDIMNKINIKAKRNYSNVGSGSDWLLTATTESTASQTKYGIFPKDEEFEFIRDSTTLNNVASFKIEQNSSSLLRVKFETLWDKSTLSVGQTITINDSLFNAKQYLIESVAIEPDKVQISALEWW